MPDLAALDRSVDSTLLFPFALDFLELLLDAFFADFFDPALDPPFNISLNPLVNHH